MRIISARMGMTGAWSLVALITARYAVLWSVQLSKVSSGLYIGPDPVASLCNGFDFNTLNTVNFTIFGSSLHKREKLMGNVQS